MLSNLQQTLAILLAPGCGSGAYWSVVDYYGSLSLALKSDLSALNSKKPVLSVLRDIQKHGETSEYCIAADQECDRVSALESVQLLSIDSSDYPPLLKEIRRAPPLLYVKGNVSALCLPQVAVVGSRNATTVGRDLAFSFSKELAEAGFAITSGLALGIDGAAHKGALAGDGPTIAVLGSGIDQCYPRRHSGLADAIVAGGGALVTEFPVGTAVLPQNFPQRNRIVSGLACGTLVVEAALKSGSLITARLALEQNREVFAVPGSIKSPVAKGCHAMIKSGAKLVESTRDIVSELGGMLALHSEQSTKGVTNGDLIRETNMKEADVKENTIKKTSTKRSSTKVPSSLSGLNQLPRLDEGQRHVFEQIGFETTSIDTIAHECGVVANTIAIVLLELELKGLIENTGLGYQRL